jgi:hypothetical protein
MSTLNHQGVLSAEAALLGLDGWLFTLGGHVDIRTLADPSHAFGVDAAIGRIREQRRVLSALTIEYLPVIVPLKELVHRDQLPAGVDRSALHGPAETLRRRLRDDDRIDVFDLTLVLNDAIVDADVYERRDDMLSSAAAWRTARAIVKRLELKLGSSATALRAPLDDAAPDPHAGELGRRKPYALVNEALVPANEHLPANIVHHRRREGTRLAAYQIVPDALMSSCEALLENPAAVGRVAVRASRGTRRVAVHLAECFQRTWMIQPGAELSPLLMHEMPDAFVDVIDERSLADELV